MLAGIQPRVLLSSAAFGNLCPGRYKSLTKQCWTKPKPEAFQSSLLQGLHRGIDTLRDVIWGETVRTVVTQ